MTKKFKSLTQEIMYHTKELLDDYETHTTKDMKVYVRDATGNKTISEGSFAGAFRDLITKEISYISPKRGIYQKISSDTILLDNIYIIINEAKKNVENELGKMDVSAMDLDKVTFNQIKATQDIKKQLDNMIEKIDHSTRMIEK